MEAAESHDKQARAAQLAQARERLDGLVLGVRTIDAELDSLATERARHRLLQDVCVSLGQLREMGGADLFWGGEAATADGLDHLRRVQESVEVFQRRLSEIETRRQSLIEELEKQQGHTYLLEGDVLEAEEEEERRRHEWIIDREVEGNPSPELTMPWTRGGEADQRFRKSVATTLMISVMFALIVPQIDLPLDALRDEAVKVPERVVRMMMESRRIPPPPPHEQLQKRPEERQAEQKRAEEPVPQQAAAPDKVEPTKAEVQGPGDVAKPEKGILAFREKFAALRDAQVDARLGLQARLNSSDDNAAERPERAMLTSNAPGSSGGINLASLSRGLGGQKGSAGSGGMAGVRVTRAASTIGGGGGGTSDRPLASGASPSRTDEEIQIVFDRYKAALYRLYNRELRKDPTLRGQVVLRLTIEPDGRVSMCVLQSSDMNAPELAAQVVDRVRSIDFGAKDVAAITIVYPIDFLPAA